MRNLKKIAICVALAMLLAGCSDSTKDENNQVGAMNSAVPPVAENVREILLNMKDYRVLFGHHSVGANMLDGLRTIIQETGADFQIAGIGTEPAVEKVHLADFSPGRNTDPKSKIDGFVKQMARLPEAFIPDAAFLKFCYVDFTPETNIEEVMAFYKEKMDTLKSQFPQTRFAHCTIPLTIQTNDLKSRIKRLLGRQVWGDASNISRSRFNKLLFETFPEDPVFDLALIESTRQDGTRVEFTCKGSAYPSLAPEYTTDGGHLNPMGRRVVASELIVFLNELKDTSK